VSDDESDEDIAEKVNKSDANVEKHYTLYQNKQSAIDALQQHLYGELHSLTSTLIEYDSAIVDILITAVAPHPIFEQII